MTPRLWDKIKNFSGLHCLAIPRRDSHICKENQTKYRNMSRKPQSHVRVLIYRTWAILAIILCLLSLKWMSKISSQTITGCVADGNWTGNFSINSGNSSKNVSYKWISIFSNFVAFYSNSLKMSNVGKFPWSWFLGDRTQV